MMRSLFVNLCRYIGVRVEPEADRDVTIDKGHHEMKY